MTEEDEEGGSGGGVPTGILVAAVLCWLVGGMTVKVTLSSAFPIWSVIANLAGGGAVIAAGFLALKGRRHALWLILLCLGMAYVVSAITHTPLKLGSTLLLIALVALGINWERLR